MPSFLTLLRPIGALIIATLFSLAAWYWLGRPVHIAEAPVDGPLNCLSYTPFRDNESPFDAELGAFDPVLIEHDLRLLSTHTSCVRIYASGGMEQIPAIAHEIGLKVIMGAWVSADGAATRQEIETLVTLANTWPDTIRAVLVGNEVLLRRELQPEALAALIREVKERVSQPVSYADVWEFQLRHAQVAEASDFVTIHILPYWEDEPVAIDDAIEHVRRIRQQVVERFSGKPVLIGETGWPSTGRMREEALPSLENEARFLRGFTAAARAGGWDYNLIEAFDQPWKRRLEGAVGGYWGIFDNDRRDKQLLSGEVSNHPQWPLYAGVAIALASVIILLLRITPALSPLVAAVAIGWTLQLEQLWLITRDGLEQGAALLLLATLLAASLATLARINGRRSRRPRLEARIALLIGCVAAILSLWLLFDSRYRDFLIAGFLPPALLMILVRGRSPVLRLGEEEIAIGILLCVSAILIPVNETIQNHQALAWSFTNLLLGSALLRRGLRARFFGA